MKTVSIVMRSRNDADIIARTIDAMLAQDFEDFEIVSFDNASTDGTREIIAKYPQIRAFQVPEGQYVPGRVLNDSVKECDAKVIVFNNSDCLPLNPKWLENLVRPILSGGAQLSYARQVCRPDADAWVKLDYSRAFADAAPDFDFFSMASSAVAAPVFEKISFSPEIKYSEDSLFAKHAREAGMKVAYAADALAEHSHNYTPKQIAKRFAGEGVADAEIFGSAQSIFGCLKRIAADCAKDFTALAKTGGLLAFPSCVRARVFQKLSYYRARRRAFKEISKA